MIPGASSRDRLAAYGIPVAIVLFQLATFRGYGIFRDEMYYLACADHLAWGYVDHPPLSIAVLAAFRAVFGSSLLAVRIAPALAAGLTAYLAASCARALSGGAFAQRLAALCAATFPLGLAEGAFFSMNAFDMVFWTAMLRLFIAILDGADPRLWLAFGAVAGFGLENKISVLFLGMGIAAGILLARRFDLLRSRWPWIGALIAGALFAPHVLWQLAHAWPTREFMDNAQRFKMSAETPLGFISQQILHAGPFLLPVWAAGVGALLVTPALRPWRAIGWAYLVILVFFIATGAKPYYLGPIYPALFAAGAVAWERLAASRPAWRWLRPALAAVVLIGGALLAPATKGLLPEETYIAYAQALHIQPHSGERHEMGRLPQHFADMHGWQALAETVARVRDGLPPDERDHLCIFGQNYGEAGAVDRFGPALGLPRAISGHNAYWMWGPGSCGAGNTWIVIGDNRETLETIFGSVTLGETFHCDLCMPFEDDNPIWICRRMTMPIDALWQKAKKFV
ncbi:MAG TPA: glycosyltransferase family 39 protein [Candidatus Polarisedimenticolaceae bacterium]|nr:glycosyltransferase family 39 protein [Candidatus Polarisedimenticolaceae bacterium]